MLTLSQIFNKIAATPQELLSEAGLPDSPFSTVSSFAIFAANLVMGLGFAAGIASIIYSAILYANSEGSPDKTKQAWSSFIFGVIAASVAVGAVALKNIVANSIGLDPSVNLDEPGF